MIPRTLALAFLLGLSCALGACNDPHSEPTNEVDLTALVVSAGPLVPAFDELLTTYTVSADSLTDATTITATTESPAATLRIAGQPAISGQPSGPIALATGANAIPVEVTGFDGITVQTYTVTVERAALVAARVGRGQEWLVLHPDGSWRPMSFDLR
jgi:cadherin-like protein